MGARPVTAPAQPNGLPGASNLSYDAAGHLLTIDHRTLTYTVWGQLETVTENDPQMGSPLWRVRYVYDALGRRIQRDYDEFVSHENPDGSFEFPHKDTRWYDYDGDTLIGEKQIDRRFVYSAIAAPLMVPDVGDGSLGLLAQQFEHSPFAARSDLSDSSDYAPSRVRGPFADPFAIVANTGNTSVLSGVGGSDSLGDALLRYGSLALVQQGSGGGASYQSYTGTGFAESIVAGICVGTQQGEYDPTGQLASVYDQGGSASWSSPYALDAYGGDNGNPISSGGGYAPPPSFPFTTAGGYRDDATGYISDPNGGMGGAYDSATGSDAEEGVDESGHDTAHAGVMAKIHQLSGHAKGALEFVANMLPPTNVITALTGRDGASGECVSVGGRVMAGMSVVPVDGLVVKVLGKLGKVGGKIAGLFRRAPARSAVFVEPGPPRNLFGDYVVGLGVGKNGVPAEGTAWKKMLDRLSDNYVANGGPLPAQSRFNIILQPDQFAWLMRNAKEIHFNINNLQEYNHVTLQELEWLLNNRDVHHKVFFHDF